MDKIDKIINGIIFTYVGRHNDKEKVKNVVAALGKENVNITATPDQSWFWIRVPFELYHEAYEALYGHEAL